MTLQIRTILVRLGEVVGKHVVIMLASPAELLCFQIAIKFI